MAVCRIRTETINPPQLKPGKRERNSANDHKRSSLRASAVSDAERAAKILPEGVELNPTHTAMEGAWVGIRSGPY